MAGRTVPAKPTPSPTPGHPGDLPLRRGAPGGPAGRQTRQAKISAGNGTRTTERSARNSVLDTGELLERPEYVHGQVRVGVGVGVVHAAADAVRADAGVGFDLELRHVDRGAVEVEEDRRGQRFPLQRWPVCLQGHLVVTGALLYRQVVRPSTAAMWSAIALPPRGSGDGRG